MGAFAGSPEQPVRLGENWKGGTIDIPPFTWFSAPAISEISKNKFSVLGRAIHLSQVHKLMQDATKG